MQNSTPQPNALNALATEARNPRTMEMDLLETSALVSLLHSENQSVLDAISAILPQIAQAVDLLVERLNRGGRLIYVGAGTSGRLGVLDASECPPTFGVSEEMVQGIIAGGMGALVYSSEGAEDDENAGANDLREKNVNESDTIVGIAASGRTPYVIGALKEARKQGALAIALVNNPNSRMEGEADLTLAALTGAEPLTGSTRLKAGTAQKLILNLLSTASMVKMGKTYSNLMVDVKASNAKLEHRALRIVQAATHADERTCERALEQAQGHAKTAILIAQLGIDAGEAQTRLERAQGHLRRALSDRPY